MLIPVVIVDCHIHCVNNGFFTMATLDVCDLSFFLVMQSDFFFDENLYKYIAVLQKFVLAVP